MDQPVRHTEELDSAFRERAELLEAEIERRKTAVLLTRLACEDVTLSVEMRDARIAWIRERFLQSKEGRENASEAPGNLSRVSAPESIPEPPSRPSPGTDDQAAEQAPAARETITAVTAEQSEFLRVVNWCYDNAGFGHLVRAASKEGRWQLRLTLPESDTRLTRFASQVADPTLWGVYRKASEKA